MQLKLGMFSLENWQTDCGTYVTQRSDILGTVKHVKARCSPVGLT